MIKNLFNFVLAGAAMTLGATMVSKGLETMRDPYKKAKIKNKFKKIKDAITE